MHRLLLATLLVVTIVGRGSTPGRSPFWLGEVRHDAASLWPVRAVAEVAGDGLGNLLRGPQWVVGDDDRLDDVLSLWIDAVPGAWAQRVDAIVLADDPDGGWRAAIDAHGAVVVLHVNVDAFDLEVVDRAGPSRVLLHELGHLVMYLDVDPAAPVPRPHRACVMIAVHACVPPGSVGAEFADAFWGAVDRSTLPAGSHPSANDVAASRFDAHPDMYVTTHAATSPVEDFAETFEALAVDDVPLPEADLTADEDGAVQGRLAKLAWLRRHPAVAALVDELSARHLAVTSDE